MASTARASRRRCRASSPGSKRAVIVSARRGSPPTVPTDVVSSRARSGDAPTRPARGSWPIVQSTWLPSSSPPSPGASRRQRPLLPLHRCLSGRARHPVDDILTHSEQLRCRSRSAAGDGPDSRSGDAAGRGDAANRCSKASFLTRVADVFARIERPYIVRIDAARPRQRDGRLLRALEKRLGL